MSSWEQTQAKGAGRWAEKADSSATKGVDIGTEGAARGAMGVESDLAPVG